MKMKKVLSFVLAAVLVFGQATVPVEAKEGNEQERLFKSEVSHDKKVSSLSERMTIKDTQLSGTLERFAQGNVTEADTAEPAVAGEAEEAAETTEVQDESDAAEATETVADENAETTESVEAEEAVEAAPAVEEAAAPAAQTAVPAARAGVTPRMETLQTIFPDPAVQNELATAMGILVTDPVTQADLDLVTFLNLNGLGVTDLTGLNRLTGLTAFAAGNNNLGTLAADTFRGLSGLTAIDLGDAGLTSLPAGIFDDLTNVVGISLENNELHTVNASVFSNMDNLMFVFLGGNGMTAFNVDTTDTIAALKVLALENNELESLSADMFTIMPVLDDLDFSGNHIIDASMIPASVTTLDGSNQEREFNAYHADPTGTTSVTLPASVLVIQGMTSGRNAVQPGGAYDGTSFSKAAIQAGTPTYSADGILEVYYAVRVRNYFDIVSNPVTMTVGEYKNYVPQTDLFEGYTATYSYEVVAGGENINLLGGTIKGVKAGAATVKITGTVDGFGGQVRASQNFGVTVQAGTGTGVGTGTSTGTNNTNAAKTAGTTPRTGDNANMMILLIAMGAAVVAIIVAVLLKRRNKKEV